jgi:predicted DNA-binding protein (MmcQ/YjbR family)
MNFERARAFCESLPAVTQDIKWGADLCFCVGGKMFAVTWLDGGLDGGKASGFSFKVDEHRFLELTDRPGIIPAPYLARAKWVQIKTADALTDTEARELLARSHALVAAKLTRTVRRELGLDAPSPNRSLAKNDPAPRSARSARPRRA